MLLLSTKLFSGIDSLQQDCIRYSRKYLLIFMYSTHTVRLPVFYFRNAYPADESKYCNVWYAKRKTFTYSMVTRGGVEDTRLEAKARPRTAFPRTDPLEAKDRNARGQGQELRTQPQVFSKTKKKGLQKSFSGNLQFIGVARIFDWEGLNHKSHAMTSSKICLFTLNQDFAKGEGLN